jgi:hypothetical protein
VVILGIVHLFAILLDVSHNVLVYVPLMDVLIVVITPVLWTIAADANGAVMVPIGVHPNLNYLLHLISNRNFK